MGVMVFVATLGSRSYLALMGTEFERWYLHHGSADFIALLQGVERGESFDALYGPLLTQD
jgi:hypothetical protein